MTENYIKRILSETQRTGDQVVSLGRIAELSDVTPGTVTTMMKSMAESDLVEYLPRQGVRLTKSGRKAATTVLRRHRLIELFLVEMLGFDWSVVHPEAEVLEHAASESIIDRIDEILGYPTADPHGDPIPTASGKVVLSTNRLLSEVTSAGKFTISRITNDDPKFLDFLKKRHLVPGRTISVSEPDQIVQTIEIRTDDNSDLTLSLAVAARIYVISK